MRRRSILALLVGLCAASLGSFASVRAEEPKPPETKPSPSLVSPPALAKRGDLITVKGKGLATATVWLCPIVASPCGKAEQVIKHEDETLTFATPGAALGTYRVRIKDAAGNGLGDYAGDLTIDAPRLEVTNLIPLIPYPDLPNLPSAAKGNANCRKTFKLTAIGSGFSELPYENVLLFNNGDTLAAPDSPCGFKVEITNSGRRAVFSGIPYDYHGIHAVQVQVGNTKKPDDPGRSVTFSQVGEGVPLLVAVGIAVALALAVYGLMSTSRQRRAMPFSQRIGSWFLEEETNSYSLSKFQFYAWTLAAVLGYLYLAAARSLVQGALELPAPPEGLATLLATAAGTTVVATGITSVKGSKGSGDFEPSFADFLTHGGVVAPERFQFFIWTLVGVLGFLAVTLLHTPADIQELPKIPEGFAALTGISALGYLGGKLARPAGPKITTVLADTKQRPVKLVVTGTMLPTTGKFTITDLEGNTRLGPDPLPLTKEVTKDGKATTETRVTTLNSDEATSKDRAKMLSIELDDAVADLLKPRTAPDKKGYRLAVIDPDGQRAEGDIALTS